MNLITINAKNLFLMERFVILLCLFLGNVNLQGAIADSMELENSERGGENESSESKLNGIKIFFPTQEWQVIEPDAIIFAGLHYRINIATGLKEAKLMDESDGSEYYQLLEKWIQDREQGNTLPSDIEGGFKIKRLFQAAKKLVFERHMHKEEDKSSTNNDENTKILYSNEVDVPGSNKYGLIEVPLLELEQSKNSRLFAPREKQQKNSFIEDLMKLDDSHASFDETINDLLKSPADKLQDSDHKSSAKAPSKFRTYEQLKQELADIELLIDDEQHIMQTLIKVHQNLTTETELIQSVEDIEYLLHNIDNAQVFIDYDGLHRVVLPALNSSSAVLHALACQLVTACVQNFPKGQIAAFEAGLLPRLLALLQPDEKSAVQGRAMSSVSGMVRQFPLAQTELIRIGLPVLWSMLRAPEHTLKAKVIALLADLLLERLSDSDTSERAQQLTVVGLESALLDLDWCHHLTENLRQTADTMLGEGDQKHDGFLDTLLHALHASVSLCPVEFRSSLSTLQRLEMTFRNQADKVTSLDKAELYQDTANSILDLMSTFVLDRSNAKQEL